MKLIFFLAIFIVVENKAKAAADDVIDDKELDALLKDPKYADLANDLLKSENLDMDSIKTDSKAKESETKIPTKKKSLKSDLELLEKTDLLSADSLKDMSLLETGSTKKEEKKEDEKIDKFKSFDFISKQQARLLIEILKQPVFFNMLPSEAQGIVKVMIFKLGSK